MASIPIRLRNHARTAKPDQNRTIPQTLVQAHFKLEAEEGIEPSNDGFANHCLTTWLLRHTLGAGRGELRAGGAGVNAWIFGNSGGEGPDRVIELGRTGAERWHQDDGIENWAGKQAVGSGG